MSVDFLDSNIFLYLFDDTAPRKQRIAEQIVERGFQGPGAAVSFEVVQECLNVILTKGISNTPVQDARLLLQDVLVPFWAVFPTPTLYERTIILRERYGYSFYDSLIIAAALEGGCDRILSEDLQHGQRIESLVIEDPFRE